MKYILVTGGVISGVGKGIVTSSIGALLKACKLKVNAIKIDPYINIDAGLFSPYEHGEVFVLDDGCEVDLDLGNYERFLDIKLTRMNNITTGKIYLSVIEGERRGDYQGKTVQIIPHITDAIQDWIEKTAKGSDPANEPDVCVIELGGTIGDIEGMPFVEALRQLRRRVHRDNFLCCHVNPVSSSLGQTEEFKTKPIQNCVKQLRAHGLIPDIIVCRTVNRMTHEAKEKVSLFTEVDLDKIFNVPRMKSVYQVPNELERQGILRSMSPFLGINHDIGEGLEMWSKISDIAINSNCAISIALVGKYTALQDSYTSVIKALEHACYGINTKPNIIYIDSSSLSSNEDNQAWKELKSCDCLIVPGGFGIRGADGKIKAIQWARENKIPFLGVCLGFQLAVIEYARNKLSMPRAHSEEFVSDEDKDKVNLLIIEMLEYLDPERKLGGTMRLGLKRTRFVKPDSLLRKLYGDQESIYERHRHRYEVNPEYVSILERAGLKFVGTNDDGTRLEILELNPKDHPYFVAVQYHPEYLSRPFRPSPPYAGLIGAAFDRQNSKNFDVLTLEE